MARKKTKTTPAEYPVDWAEVLKEIREACVGHKLEEVQAEAAETIERLQTALNKIRTKLESFVCTKKPDVGVVLLSYEGTTTYDPELKIQVYDHDHFSPLGDALIELYELAGGTVEE